jgi:hypothetical protein
MHPQNITATQQYNSISFAQQVTFLAGLTVVALVSTWSVFFLV